MTIERLENLFGLIDKIEENVDQKTSKQLQITKSRRIAEKLVYYGKECEECRDYLNELEGQLMHLKETGSVVEEPLRIKYKKLLNSILSHLQKKHKIVTEGYYMNLYMSIGISLGLVFGITIFDNIALGLPLGIGVGIAIGASVDADAKKKGLTI